MYALLHDELTTPLLSKELREVKRAELYVPKNNSISSLLQSPTVPNRSLLLHAFPVHCFEFLTSNHLRRGGRSIFTRARSTDTSGPRDLS